MASNLASGLFSALKDLNHSDNVTRNTLVLGFVVCFVVYWWITRTKYRLPPGPTGLPILGYLPFLGKRPHQVLKKLSEKYGNVFGLYFGRVYVVALGDYDTVKEGLTMNLGRPKFQFDFLPDGGGFSTENSTEWSEQRKFTMRVMRDIGLSGRKWETMLLEEIQDFLKIIEDHKGSPMNCTPFLNESISNNIHSLIIGKRLPVGDPARQIIDKVVYLTMQLADASSLRAFCPIISNVLSKLGIGGEPPGVTESLREFTDFLKSQVNERKRIRETEDANTFIDEYLTEIENNVKNGLNNSFDERSLRGNTLALLSAGSDPTSTLLHWLFIAMATFPEVQEKVHRELDSVLGKDGQAKYTERTLLPYTYAVQLECSRWMPIVPIPPARVALEDTKIGGYDVPKDTLIISNFWDIHRSPVLWKEPEKLIPERFLTDKGQVLESKIEGYLPFSIGRRNCPGELVAKMTIFLFFTAMMQRFNVLPSVGQTPKLEGTPGIIFRPVDQELRYVPRQ